MYLHAVHVMSDFVPHLKEIFLFGVSNYRQRNSQFYKRFHRLILNFINDLFQYQHLPADKHRPRAMEHANKKNHSTLYCVFKCNSGGIKNYQFNLIRLLCSRFYTKNLLMT